MFLFFTDYYYQTCYNDDSLPSKETELCVQQSQCAQASALDPQDESHIDSGSYAGADATEGVSHRQEDAVTSDSQVTKAHHGERQGSSIL